VKNYEALTKTAARELAYEYFSKAIEGREIGSATQRRVIWENCLWRVIHDLAQEKVAVED
jgi:hypothetical protein